MTLLLMPSLTSQTRRIGSALLIVLAMLLLISALVMAFFTAVTTERTVARSFSDSGAVRNLANTALQLAMAQVADATAGGTAASPLAWASQPGMIRTYDTSGAPYRYYKLYSATAMTVTNAATFSITNDVPPSGWQSSPGVWTDLNAPVAASAGTLNYPIVDPVATNTPVQGFSITSPPGYSGGTASATNNPAPMPVRWLYQLKDGTLVPAANSGGTIAGASTSNPIVGRIAFWTDDETCKVNINTAAEGTYWDTPRFAAASPTAANTMSGTTILSSEVAKYPDYGFSCFQPSQFEFQRYPGHPAQVALSTIFPGVTTTNAAGLIPRVVWGGSKGGTTWAGNTTVTPKIDLSAAPRKALFASVDEFQFSGAGSTPRTDNNPGNTLTKADLEAAKFFITSSSRAPEVNLFNLPRIACWPVDKSLAANPSSERTTAYDRLIAFCSTLRNDLGVNAYRYYFQRGDAQSPTADYSGISRNQDLYAYLQRLTRNPVPGFGGNFLDKYPSDRDQILTEIFDYIRCTNLHDPALSTPLAASWSTSANQFVNAINTPLDGNVTHLQGLGQVMPIRIGSTMGFGRFVAIKEVGLVFVCVGDGTLPDTSSITNATTLATYIADSTKPTDVEKLLLISNIPAANGSGIPATAPSTVSAYLQTDPAAWGQVRNKWLASVAAGLTSTTSPYPNPALGANYFNPALCGTPVGPDERRLQTTVLYRLNCPAAGMNPLYPDLIVEMEGLENFSVTNAMNISPGAALFTKNLNSSGWFHTVGNVWSRVYSNPLYFDSLLNGRSRTPVPFPNYTEKNIPYPYYPFVSQAFTIKTASPIAFSGGNLTVRIYQGKNAYDDKNTKLGASFKAPSAPKISDVIADPTNLYQTATMTFPGASFPLPTLFTGLSSSSQQDFQMEDKLVQGNAGAEVVRPNDVVRSMCYNGDGRLAAVTENISVTITGNVSVSNFSTYPNYSSNSTAAEQQLDSNNGALGWKTYRIGGNATQTVPSGCVPPGTAATSGDFDIACRIGPGPFINKPDEGDGNLMSGAPPYYFFDQNSANANLYTPNRIMPSPGMFGSLPTGAKAGVGWKTLLFRPQPSHPSYSTTIPDHLIMDLFWMPIVEPYAISEPFSTAGKINMNYQILPFTYINRSTGVLSAMKIEMGCAVPNGTTDKYQSDPGNGLSAYRKTLNLSDANGTLRQFKEKFASGDIFRSASQICDIYLTPRDQAWASDSDAQTFWSSNLNTPDNLREKPYANLYARLTTKSNTYTVHVRAQVLQKVPGTPADQWVEGRDRVAAEERASTLIERYVDVEDTTLPNFATDANARLSAYYRMRVLSTKRFAP